jgi:hypothetical protein
MSNDLCSCRLNGSKSKQDCGAVSNTLSFVHDSRTSFCCTLATLERLSSQLESLIVRTEFCHTRINRTLSGAILGARLGGEIFVSEWRRSRRNVLALRSSMPRQVEWIWRGDCAQLQVPRQKCEKRHRLDSGAPGRLGRSVCTIMHGDYELLCRFQAGC